MLQTDLELSIHSSCSMCCVYILLLMGGKTCTRFRSREAKVPIDFTYRPSSTRGAPHTTTETAQFCALFKKQENVREERFWKKRKLKNLDFIHWFHSSSCTICLCEIMRKKSLPWKLWRVNIISVFFFRQKNCYKIARVWRLVKKKKFPSSYHRETKRKRAERDAALSDDRPYTQHTTESTRPISQSASLFQQHMIDNFSLSLSALLRNLIST